MDLPKLWASVKADLARARSTLPEDAVGHEAIRFYQEFLDHNELELACDMLDEYADDHPVSKEFWSALRDAAVKMQLPTASRYETKSEDFPR
jgi:hypothetical protein